jgi:hypothetical protein
MVRRIKNQIRISLSKKSNEKKELISKNKKPAKKVIKKNSKSSLSWESDIIANPRELVEKTLNLIIEKTYNLKTNRVNSGKVTIWYCPVEGCKYKFKREYNEIGNSSSYFESMINHVDHNNENDEELILSNKVIKLNVTSNSSIKPNKIYQSLIEKEKLGEKQIDADTKELILKRIRQYKYELKQKSNESKTIISFSQIESLLKKFLLDKFKLEDESDFIVLNYRLGTGTEDNPFTIIFSSYTCLKFAKDQVESNEGIGLI